MLDRFTVRDFKSLVDVDVDLGIVNVFVGANGSGKSNLLEALGVLGAAASGRVDDESLKYRGVRPGLPVLYKSSFMGNRAAPFIVFEGSGFGGTYLVSLRNPLKEPDPGWTYSHEQLLRGSDKIVSRSPRSKLNLNGTAGLAALESVKLPPSDPAERLLDALRHYAIYAPDTQTLRGLEPDQQSREPVGLAGGRLPEGLKTLDRLIQVKSGNGRKPLLPRHLLRSEVLPLIDWLASFGVTDTSDLPISASVPQQGMGLKLLDKYMSNGRDILSGYDASEGALYLFYFSVLALHPKTPRLFAIDNFDQTLNPRTAREFTQVFCRWLLEKQDRQVLLTTHNPLVLDGLPLRDDNVRLFAVDRSKRGHTVVSRVEVNDSLMRAAEKGMPLSQQWVNGHFGGVPIGV